MPFSISELSQYDPACRACVKRYIKKHDLKRGDTFKLPCHGIKRQALDDYILSGLADPETALSMYDPVLWAKKNLDWICLDPEGDEWKRKSESGALPSGFAYWTPREARRGKSPFHRPYQAELLRCSSKRKVSRIGRQAGKCLVSGSLVHMANGSLKPIEKVKDGDLVFALDHANQFVPSEAYLSCNGEKEVAELQLSDGRKIEASLNHPFLVRRNYERATTGKRNVRLQNEWIELRDIQKGYCVAVPRKVPEGSEQLNLEECSLERIGLLGLLLADGNMTSDNCRFTNNNPVVIQHLKQNVAVFDCSIKQYQSDKENDYHITGQGMGKVHPVKSWLRVLGLYGLDSHQKYIPDFVMRLRNQDLVYFLQCMYGCDGWASVNKDGSSEIGYCSVSEKMAYQILVLLSRFGIYADFQKKKVKYTYKGITSYRFAFQVCIRRKADIVRFVDNIGLLGKEKEAQRTKEAALIRNSSPKTEVYEEENIVFIPVKSVTPKGTKLTWDLTVLKNHNFIANNIVSHNSEALCVFILFKMFTERGYSVVVITPYQSQVELIYKRLFELLETSPELINSVKIRRKSPNHYIELHNGSSIKMFTAGTKSNAEAGVVRGTHANLLIFDEADMLSRGDLDSSLALIMNFPEAIVWMSSTPTGKRETFYKKCNDDEFKEFHFPSSVNPTWDDEKERFFRKGLTELGYVHEILANFGEDVQGVYQKKYIAAAQADYEYDSMEPQRTWIYSMGVDWNDNFGTVIRIVGMNPGDNCIYAVARHLVKRDGWTQTDAVAQIVNLNRKWQPQFIYVDKGHGHAQVELLHGVGAKAMRKGGNSVDVRLASIVKAYDFGSNVEIKDLFTRQPVKKPAKPFLVESSVRCFEDGRIRYPKSDTKYTAALEGYHIVRRTDAGIPKYGFLDEAVGDHDIDAMNLAIVAFALEVGEFGNPPHVSNVAFSGYFGENKAEQEERKERIKETENRSKELGKRTTDLMKPAIVRSFGMPAANTTYDREESANIRVWSWPGWLRDEPAPKRKNRGRRSRPSRTNI